MGCGYGSWWWFLVLVVLVLVLVVAMVVLMLVMVVVPCSGQSLATGCWCDLDVLEPSTLHGLGKREKQTLRQG